VADHSLSPKSVARDLYERAMTFTEFVGHYGLARSEGVVLRYLSDAYKALERTVPEEAKTDELYDLTEWLGELVRQVDSSLLDEWEQLQHPTEAPTVPLDHAPPALTANRRAFRVVVRNALFRRVELAAARRFDELGELDGGHGWSADRWRDALSPYFEEHHAIDIDADARNAEHLVIDERQGEWTARQVLVDPEGFNEWAILATVDLAASDAAGAAVVRVVDVGRLAGL
jgi:hypothetical protein